MLADRRVAFLLAGTVVLLGWATVTLLTWTRPMVVGLPLVAASWLLVLMESAYLFGREKAHQRRRRASRGQRDAWTPDPGVRKPIDYLGVVSRPADDVVDQQGRFRAAGIRLAVLPALAVMFLTVQTVFLGGGGPLAVGFVLAECLLLVVMVWTVWTSQQPSLPWVTRRVRAELFRREMFLLLTGVGPYFGLPEERAQVVRDARLNLLANANATELSRLACLADRGADGVEEDWQDEVWRGGFVAADADVVERMRTYLDYRVRRQGLYFELAAEKCERVEKNLSGIAKGAVLTGVGVALAYAAVLVSHPHGEGPPSMTAVVALLAAGAPPLCNSVLAVQNLFASQRLAASYLEARQELLAHENTLRRLLADASAPDGATSFRALVVRAEATLTEELRRWRIIVAKPEFEAGL